MKNINLKIHFNIYSFISWDILSRMKSVNICLLKLLIICYVYVEKIN